MFFKLYRERENKRNKIKLKNTVIYIVKLEISCSLKKKFLMKKQKKKITIT